MRILFVTQALDLDDPVLSAYHDWVAALARRVDSVVTICLKEGRHNLPDNVHVYSLGKEHGAQSSFLYALRFLSLAWKLRSTYDRVFVHMNQEYLLIAGWLWKWLGKRMYMWRNHYAGSFLTDIAASFCTKVFCTSRYSYTAKYKKTEFMPVGIDVERFLPDASVRREPRSILFLARIAPSKRPDLLIEALGSVLRAGESFTASLYGSSLPEHARYAEQLRAQVEQLGLHDRVQFHAGIPNAQTPNVYRTHDIFVNCSQSGMFDKTLFEAAACGCYVLAASEDFRDRAGTEHYFTGAPSLAEHLTAALARPPEQQTADAVRMRQLAQSENLATLIERLVQKITT